jgi:hypothetical protein
MCHKSSARRFKRTSQLCRERLFVCAVLRAAVMPAGVGGAAGACIRSLDSGILSSLVSPGDRAVAG